jgi:hypothetical protein
MHSSRSANSEVTDPCGPIPAAAVEDAVRSTGGARAGEATIGIAAAPTRDGAVPVAMYFDDAQRRWVASDTSTYDATRHVVTIRTTHFSWWGLFGWNRD